jgi:Glycosyl transferases group 1
MTSHETCPNDADDMSDPATIDAAVAARHASEHRVPALFVAHRQVLAPSGGGVQVCNREYVALLEGAGFRLQVISYDFDRSLRTRVANRLFPKLLPAREPRDLAERIALALRASGTKHVFHAMNTFPAVLREIDRKFSDVRQVLLSHGAEAVDFCIEQGLRRGTGTENRARATAERMLGRDLLDQLDQRRHLDAVLTLAPLDAEIEKWLGARKVLSVPRTILHDRLALRPVDGRVGCVATLDHPPNFSGLARLLGALDGRTPAGFRLRVVGGPVSSGEKLAAQHDLVDYLGPLDDEALRAEAATWCCFVNPIFVYAKGCSTKLAVALGWGLPIATTRFGARGYHWDETAIPLADDPTELADLVLARTSTAQFPAHCRATDAVVATSPDRAHVAAQIRDFVLQP